MIIKMNANKKQMLKESIFFFANFMILFIFAEKCGFSKLGLSNPKNWNEIIENMPFYFILSLLISTVKFIIDINKK